MIPAFRSISEMYKYLVRSLEGLFLKAADYPDGIAPLQPDGKLPYSVTSQEIIDKLQEIDENVKKQDLADDINALNDFMVSPIGTFNISQLASTKEKLWDLYQRLETLESSPPNEGLFLKAADYPDGIAPLQPDGKLPYSVTSQEIIDKLQEINGLVKTQDLIDDINALNDVYTSVGTFNISQLAATKEKLQEIDERVKKQDLADDIDKLNDFVASSIGTFNIPQFTTTIGQLWGLNQRLERLEASPPNEGLFLKTADYPDGIAPLQPDGKLPYSITAQEIIDKLQEINGLVKTQDLIDDINALNDFMVSPIGTFNISQFTSTKEKLWDLYQRLETLESSPPKEVTLPPEVVDDTRIVSSEIAYNGITPIDRTSSIIISGNHTIVNPTDIPKDSQFYPLRQVRQKYMNVIDRASYINIVFDKYLELLDPFEEQTYQLYLLDVGTLNIMVFIQDPHGTSDGPKWYPCGVPSHAAGPFSTATYPNLINLIDYYNGGILDNKLNFFDPNEIQWYIDKHPTSSIESDFANDNPKMITLSNDPSVSPFNAFRITTKDHYNEIQPLRTIFDDIDINGFNQTAVDYRMDQLFQFEAYNYTNRRWYSLNPT